MSDYTWEPGSNLLSQKAQTMDGIRATINHYRDYWDWNIVAGKVAMFGEGYTEKAEAKAACEKWLAIVQREAE